MLPLLLVPVLAAPVVQPPWIQVLPVQPGRVYGLGVAPLAGAEAAAVREASDNGRADVIARLRANVKADTRITTTTVETRGTGAAPAGTRTQSAQVGTEVQAQAADLPGLVVEETWLDRPGRTGYALAYLDLGIAQRELRTRFDTLNAELAAPSGEQGVRARLVRVQALKKAHAGLVQLDDLAGLLSGGGGDPDLRGEVLKTRLDTERQLLAARASLTFGLAPSPGLELDPEVAAAVRTAVLKEGMGWSRADPMFAITLRVKTGRNGQAVLVGLPAVTGFHHRPGGAQPVPGGPGRRGVRVGDHQRQGGRHQPSPGRRPAPGRLPGQAGQGGGGLAGRSGRVVMGQFRAVRAAGAYTVSGRARHV